MNRALIALLALALGACATQTPRATPAVPASFTAPMMGAIPDASAWERFGDAGLAAWIHQVWANNPEIEAAVARLDAAAAEARAIGADWLPNVDGEASVERRKLSELDPDQSSPFQTAEEFGEPPPKNPRNRHARRATLNYELDLRGRVRAAVRAGEAEREASRFDREVLRLSLARQTAELWFTRAELAAGLSLAERTAQATDRLWRSEEQKRAVGLATGVSVAEQQVRAAQAEAARIAQAEVLRRAENELCALAALAPVDCRLPPHESLSRLTVPDTGNDIPAGLLQRRPDLAAAQARYDAARAQVDQAKAMRWPALTLAGEIGASAGTWSDLTRSQASSWFLLPQITVPLFDGGRLRANVSRAEAGVAEQLAQWRAAITRAVLEVENAGLSLAAAEEQRIVNERELSAAERQWQAVQAARAVGLQNNQTVLAAEIQRLQAESRSLATHRQELVAGANLIAALGGGWSSPP